MDISPIAYAIPVFFVLIALEFAVAKAQQRDVYRFHDSVTDLSCGIGSIILGAATKAAGLAAYTAVWHFGGFFEIEQSVATWVAVFIGVDFFYYWFHRAAHRINVFWAGHVVHHQSEDYNLAVALRQSWYLPLVEWLFYAPLAVLGFNPLMYITAKTFNTLYQFWIHTEVVRSLGPLESVLNTPSHHRVHHGQNPQYIDKNYAGILIIWDRLFGTYEPEDDEVVYGTIKPLASWNPLWANLEHWKTIWDRVLEGPTFKDRVYAVVGPPGWRPGLGELETPEITASEQVKYETETSHAIDVYVAANFVLAIAATTAFMVFEKRLPPAQLAAFGAVILVGVIAWGGLFESRRWALTLEVVRWATLPAVAWWLGAGDMSLVAGVSALTLVGIGGLLVAWRAPEAIEMWAARSRRATATEAAREPGSSQQRF